MIAWVQAAPPVTPRTAAQWTEQANSDFRGGRLPEAAAAFQQADTIAALPDKDRFVWAMTLAGLERVDEARTQLERLPDSARKLYWLGRLDFAQGRYPSAMEHLRAAIRHEPRFARAHDALGLCHEARNEWDLAAAEYRRAIESGPGVQIWPLYNLGSLLARQGKLADAEVLLTRVLKESPSFAPALYRLGRIREEQDKDDEATGLYQRSIEAEPTFAEPHFALSRLYRKKGDTAAAEREMAEFERLRQQARPGVYSGSSN